MQMRLNKVNRSSLVIIVSVFILCGADFYVRILSDSSAMKNIDLVAPNENKLATITPILNQSYLNKIKLQYQGLESQNQAEQVSNEQSLGLSIEEQQAQKGLLQTVYSGNFALTLKAIVKIETVNQVKPKYQALINETNLSDNKQQVVKVEDGALLHDYLVKIRSNKQILLTKGDSEPIQLTMYEIN